jgi:hypothetical protein
MPWLADKSKACPSTLLSSVYTLFGSTGFQGGVDMGSTLRLYNMLVFVFSSHQHWVDHSCPLKRSSAFCRVSVAPETSVKTGSRLRRLRGRMGRTALSGQTRWVALRHLKTLAWMIVDLMHSGKISLTAWTPYVYSRAVYAQSSVRRFARWLENAWIAVHALYSPLMQHA